MNILSVAFNNMLNNEPELMTTLGATCFEHKVALFMNRYKIKKEENAVEEHKHRKCTPDDYMLAFKDGLGVQCERFASPLVFNPEMQQYYSLHDRDKVFGLHKNIQMHTAPNGRELRKLTLHGRQMAWTRP